MYRYVCSQRSCGDGLFAFPQKSDSVINVNAEFGGGGGKVPLDAIAECAKKYQSKPKITYKMIQEYVEKKYGFKVYKPKRYLVVGRRNDFECDEWIEIKSDYTDVEIVTYDDLVDTVVSQFYQ